MGSEECIYSRNKLRSYVKAVGTCSLVLSSGYDLELERTFYIPNFSRNLISISRLVPLGYSFNFSSICFSLYYISDIVGNGILSHSLFRINLQNNATYTTLHVQNNAGVKRCVMNEESSMLWHRRLGHTFIQRTKRLVNDGVLGAPDFTDFETCVDCIKGKQTNMSKKGAKRSSDLLEIIHTNICCPDMHAYCQKYFISFIDDYSRYM